MTVRIVQGDMFASGADVLVNPVNCVGVSGAGLAKIFAERFTTEQAQYEKFAKRGELHLGDLLAVSRIGQTGARHIIYFPTKQHWRDQSHLGDIEEGLYKLRAWLQTSNVRDVAVPALGCGYGGLHWEQVRPAAVRILGVLQRVDVMLYEPVK